MVYGESFREIREKRWGRLRLRSRSFASSCFIVATRIFFVINRKPDSLCMTCEPVFLSSSLRTEDFRFSTRKVNKRAANKIDSSVGIINIQSIAIYVNELPCISISGWTNHQTLQVFYYRCKINVFSFIHRFSNSFSIDKRNKRGNISIIFIAFFRYPTRASICWFCFSGIFHFSPEKRFLSKTKPHVNGD